jgi:hypothetical protein
MYYTLNQKLPDKLADLAPLADVDRPLEFTCPVSGKPYLYDMNGVLIPGKPGRIFVCDPEPSHSSLRWAIMVPDSEGGPLVPRVIAITEAEFAQRLPAAGPVQP